MCLYRVMRAEWVAEQTGRTLLRVEVWCPRIGAGKTYTRGFSDLSSSTGLVLDQ
jgi:hypothetical protein